MGNLSGHTISDYLDNLHLQPRFERKFVVPGLKLFQVEQLVRFHSLRFNQIYLPRRINNIYFDTANFRFFHDSIEGLANRIKVRLRWYGSLLNGSEEQNLEIKIKNNLKGYKLVFPLTGMKIARNTKPEDIKGWLMLQELPELAVETLVNLQPVLVNSYYRNYWLSNDKKVRLTLDTDLQYYPFIRSTDILVGPLQHDNYSILEIKNHPSDDNIIKDIGLSFLPRIARYSKYTNGVDLLINEQTITN